MAAEANVKAGALLGFKVGLQADVDTMLAAGANAGAQHGCFYLTKDSHRLYVGNEDSSLSAVNEGIQTVTWNELSTIASTAAASTAGVTALTGRFYYASDQNILCVYNGQEWVKLNQNDDTTISTHSFDVSTTSGVATVTDTIVDSDGQSFPASFTVTGANGVAITSTGTAITITGDTYTLSSADGTTNGTVDIKLDSSGTNNDSKVTLSPGSNVQLARDNNGVISISATDNYVNDVDVTAESVGFKFKVTNSGGASEEDTIDPKIAVFTSADPNASASTAGATDSVSFVSGTATLDVYSRGAIDQKLKAVNAMVYRGTIGTSGTAATAISYDSDTGVTSIVNGITEVPVSIGDTFLAISGGEYGNVSYKPGTLFIVRAKPGASEGTDGFIASGDYICDVVAEQWNSDTTYILAGVTSGIKLHASTGADVGSFIVTAGVGNDWIDISESETDVIGVTGAKNKTLTVTHKTVTRTDTTGTAQNQSNHQSITVPIVTGVTSDNAGHITGVETTSYTIKDTNASLTSMSAATSTYSTSGANGYNAGVISTSTTLTSSDGSAETKTASVVVSSSSLAITDEDSRQTAASGGSTAQGLKIEMVWGSF